MNTIDAQTVRPGEYPIDVHVRKHTFTADASVAAGGQDSAPGAHDYFDSALAACKAITAMWYAKRHGIPLERVESHVESDDSHERNGVYKLRVRVELFGSLTDDQRAQVQRAIAACPIHKLMTASEVQIELA
ncbi:MAG TPA: OsmC family protein [Kofleriaceae bacterium]|jgi:putative redox protein